MRQVSGIWIPDLESYLAPRLEDPEYADRYDDYLFEKISGGRIAIDVGANIGLWSRKLARRFSEVHAFEPLGTARECFVLNVREPNVVLHPEALGDRNGTTSIFISTFSSFKTHIHGRSGPISIRTLDSFGFTGIDLIKIDCEGFDSYVIEGARETIKRERPMVIFEAKPKVGRKRYGIEEGFPRRLIESLGYSVELETRGNLVCCPNGSN